MSQALFLILMLLALPCAAQPNYQERSLYLGEEDNVCIVGDQYDLINLVINVDDSEILKLTANGYTLCFDWVMPYYRALSPSDGFIYVDDSHRIIFKEETTYLDHRGVIYNIVQKTTVTSAVLYGKNYDCTIRGDGKVQHFGIKFDEFDPATFQIMCVPGSPTKVA